jgi:diguanylate cyclase (GGDEF)-like protein
MQVDTFTVILFGLLVKVPLAFLFFIFWLNSRRASWFAWWCATAFFGSLTAVFLLVYGYRGEPLAAALAVPSLILTFGCCWQGARAFEKRAPLWLPLFAVPAVWIAACLVPGFLACVGCRVALSSCLLAPMLAMSAVEFWRGREERLPSRPAVIAVFASLALVFAVRIPLIGVAPFPFGAQPATPAWLAIFNLLIFFHTMVLAVLLVAMTKERLELQQRTKAQTDPLTGALNRRAFTVIGRRLLLRHRKQHEPLSLIFIDLDHFKSLNDRYGHFVGDEVLINFVAIVQDNIRPTDFLFRMGGEEFCCVLPYTGTDEALGVAERIRRQAEAAMPEVAGRPVHVTVSVGVSSTDVFGYDIDLVMHSADLAVYDAKRQGRNRVVAAAADVVVSISGPTPVTPEKRVAAR